MMWTLNVDLQNWNGGKFWDKKRTKGNLLDTLEVDPVQSLQAKTPKICHLWAKTRRRKNKCLRENFVPKQVLSDTSVVAIEVASAGIESMTTSWMNFKFFPPSSFFWIVTYLPVCWGIKYEIGLSERLVGGYQGSTSTGDCVDARRHGVRRTTELCFQKR